MAELKLAFWGERFLAWLIDTIIIGVIVGSLNLFTFSTGRPFPFLVNLPGVFSFFNFSVAGIIFFLYWLFMDGANGQSFGKMVMRLRIIRLDRRPVTKGQAAVESVGKAFFPSN